MQSGDMSQPDQPQGPPDGGGQQQQGQTEDVAGKAIQSIQSGFQQIGQMVSAAKDQVGPDVLKLFQQAVSSTDAFLQALSGGGADDGGQPQRPMKSGPMASNANAKAQVAPNQG